jgi:hypothetical protein
MLTRDSKVLWLAFAVAIFTYLATKPSPVLWTYADWIQAGSFVAVWAAGKLGNSPLEGKP